MPCGGRRPLMVRALCQQSSAKRRGGLGTAEPMPEVAATAHANQTAGKPSSRPVAVLGAPSVGTGALRSASSRDAPQAHAHPRGTGLRVQPLYQSLAVPCRWKRRLPHRTPSRGSPFLRRVAIPLTGSSLGARQRHGVEGTGPPPSVEGPAGRQVKAENRRAGKGAAFSGAGVLRLSGFEPEPLPGDAGGGQGSRL